MNIGTHPSICYIYSLNWKEHSEAITLNRKHGAFSVEMLKKWKVALTIKQEEMLKDNKNKSNKKAKLYFLREVLLSFFMTKRIGFFGLSNLLIHPLLLGKH